MHWFSLLEVNRACNVLVCLDTQRPARMRLICELVCGLEQTNTSALVLVIGIGHCRGRLDLAVDRDHAPMLSAPATTLHPLLHPHNLRSEEK
jgi:hypothetical protein